MTSKLDPQELERLSKAATQGVWEISAYYTGTGPDEKCYGLVEVEDFPIGIIDEEGATAESLSPNLEFVTTLVNAYRTGQLVPAMPSGDVVEAVARAIMVAKGGKCLVEDWSIERRDNPHVALAWDQATAAITAYETVSGVAKMREALRAVNDAETPSSWESAVDELIEAARAALGEKP